MCVSIVGTSSLVALQYKKFLHGVNMLADVNSIKECCEILQLDCIGNTK